MGILVSEEQIGIYRTTTQALVSDLGRNVTIYIPGPKKECWNCLIDPINKRSTGIYAPKPLLVPAGQVLKPFTGGICPVCNGTAQFTTQTSKVIKCSIRWLKAIQKGYVVQGFDAENDFKLKAPINNQADFENARYVEIDGVNCQVSAIVKRGLRDLIWINVWLKRSEWSSGSRGTQDVSKF